MLEQTAATANWPSILSSGNNGCVCWEAVVKDFSTWQLIKNVRNGKSTVNIFLSLHRHFVIHSLLLANTLTTLLLTVYDGQFSKLINQKQIHLSSEVVFKPADRLKYSNE